jgi:queuosine precursor transporter
MEESTPITKNRETKFLIIVGIFMAAITFVNLVSAKLITIFGLTLSVGGLFYAITFPCTDLLSECWGRDKARKIVIIGFLANILIVIFTWIAVAMPPADFWAENQEAFATLFGFVPRIVLGSMVAYLFSQLHDVWSFHFWRHKTKNKHLWLRNNASTITSQLIDTIIFVTIAFAGTMPMSALISIMIGQYIVKVVIAAVDTPIIYWARNWIGVPKELIEEHSS